MKLLLDSQALERLLGGDTELEVKIRTGIANQFADKFLKSLVNSQLVTTTGMQIEELIRKEVLSGSKWNMVLNTKYKQIVIDGIYEAMSTLIAGIVAEEIETKRYKFVLDNFVEQQATIIANEWTSANIEERINKEADRKIKEKLGLS